jgi:hypothetical protein
MSSDLPEPKVRPSFLVGAFGDFDVRCGVIIDRGSELCRPPTSASPRKLTSGPNEKLVAKGQEATYAVHKRVRRSEVRLATPGLDRQACHQGSVLSNRST